MAPTARGSVKPSSSLARASFACVAGLVCVALVFPPTRARAQDAAPPAAATNASALQLELDAVVSEREGTTRLWPGLLLGTGIAGVVGGAVAGVGYIHGCDGDACAVPAWVALVVVAGAALGTGGAIWLVRTNHNLAQLDMKASMLRLEMERYRERSALDRRELALGRASPWLSLRFAL